MAIDERSWLELMDAARRALGEESAVTFVELLRGVTQREDTSERDPIVQYSDLEWALIEVLGPLLNARFAHLGQRIDAIENRERARAR